uniref:Ribonucleotide reductase large subunit C-terminal domain-containing protein n=1 Tax=Parascaris equorum TaxID=6256 RepID=A0A914RHE3_PAREQ
MSFGEFFDRDAWHVFSSKCQVSPGTLIFIAFCIYFQIFNPHLLKDLVDLGLWDDEMKLEIIAHKGSVQSIERIPLEMRNLYKTVWELSQKCQFPSVLAGDLRRWKKGKRKKKYSIISRVWGSDLPL